MLKVTVPSLNLLRQTLKKFPQKIDTALRNPAFTQPAAKLFEAAAQKRIGEGVRPPLLAKTLREKSRLGYSNTPLVRSRVGRNTITGVASGDGVVLTLKGYMAAHHFGVQKSVSVKSFTRKSKSRGGKTTTVKAHNRRLNLPARPFLGVLKPSEETSLLKYLTRAF
jgi:phage gpG-like protein